MWEGEVLKAFLLRHRFDIVSITLDNWIKTYWGGPPLGVQKFYIPFQPQKWASNKSNSSVTSSCASCGFLQSRLESQSWNSFNPFPIVNMVSAGVPTPPDSGKTPQLKTSKLAQNCSKMEVLHLQPSYVRSLGGRRRGTAKTNNASRDQSKTEQCDVQSWQNDPLPTQIEKSILPAMSQRNQHLTHAMLRKPATTTPKHNMVQSELETFNQQPCSRNPAIPQHLQEYCFLLKEAPAKRSLQQSVKILMNPQLSSASSKSFSRR